MGEVESTDGSTRAAWVEIPRETADELVSFAAIDQEVERDRALLLLGLVQRAVGVYQRTLRGLEDAPRPDQKVRRVEAAREHLKALLNHIRALEEFSGDWQRGGRDLREKRRHEDASVWSMVAGHFQIPEVPARLPRLELRPPVIAPTRDPRLVGPRPPIDYRTNSSLDLHEVARALEIGVAHHPDLVRRILVGLRLAVEDTLEQDLVDRPTGRGKHAGTSARNYLIHQLGRVFSFAHAVEVRRSDGPVPLDDQAAAGKRRERFVGRALKDLIKGKIAERTIQNVLGEDLVDKDDGRTVSLRLSAVPPPSEQDWALLLRELRRKPGSLGRAAALRPLAQAGLSSPWPIELYEPDGIWPPAAP